MLATPHHQEEKPLLSADAVTDTLRDLILSGAYGIGVPLKQEVLAKRFGVSRIPVREALKRLEAEGLVDHTPHQGSVVAAQSIPQLLEALDIRVGLEARALKLAIPHMKAAGWGRVINLCSLNGVNAHMGSLEYNTAKEALRTLTRTAAREWAPTGVVCNAICPAAKSASFKRVMAEHPELVASADAANPMGRMGDPYDDIAPVALFLASEDCRYMTGNTLFVDGGSHINGSSWAPDLPNEPSHTP